MMTYVCRVINGGLYEEKWRVTVDKRLPNAEYSSCGIRYEKGMEILISYNVVAAIHTDEGWLCIYCMPTKTSKRHVVTWCRKWGITYRRLKELYTEHIDYNTETGEIRPHVVLPKLQSYVGERIR